MAHNASVVLGRVVPSPLILALWGDVVVHYVHELPAFLRLPAQDAAGPRQDHETRGVC